AFVINKADRPGVKELERDLNNMLDDNPAIHAGEAWRPPIVRTVATKDEGIDAGWQAVCDHRRWLEDRGELAERRRRRLAEALRTIVVGLLERRARHLVGGEGFA